MVSVALEKNLTLTKLTEPKERKREKIKVTSNEKNQRATVATQR